MAKAFDTIWVKGLLYKLSVLNFPSYLMKTHIFTNCEPNMQTPFQSTTSTCNDMVAQGDVSRCCSVCERHTQALPAQYADNTALVATTRSPPPLLGYPEFYLGRHEHGYGI
jgi:hypothetical protein